MDLERRRDFLHLLPRKMNPKSGNESCCVRTQISQITILFSRRGNVLSCDLCQRMFFSSAVVGCHYDSTLLPLNLALVYSISIAKEHQHDHLLVCIDQL